MARSSRSVLKRRNLYLAQKDIAARRRQTASRQPTPHGGGLVSGRLR